MMFPIYNGDSKFDGLASDARLFEGLAEYILDKAEGVNNNNNKGILAFIAGGLMDAAAGMEEYIEDEVQRN